MELETLESLFSSLVLDERFKEDEISSSGCLEGLSEVDVEFISAQIASMRFFRSRSESSNCGVLLYGAVMCQITCFEIKLSNFLFIYLSLDGLFSVGESFLFFDGTFPLPSPSSSSETTEALS